MYNSMLVLFRFLSFNCITDTIFFCDSFHGEKKSVHTACPASFKKKYWSYYIPKWSFEAADINTSSAEQINAKLRNLQATIQQASMSYYQEIFLPWAALNNMLAKDIYKLG